MKMSELDRYLERTPFGGTIDELVEQVGGQYDWGEVTGRNFLAAGIEDCNIRITCDTGEYNLKVFSADRSTEDVERYVEIMEEVIAAGIRHPKLFGNNGGASLTELQNGTQLVLLGFIPGETYFDIDSVPNDAELSDLFGEVVKLHRMNYKPDYSEDSWAAQGFNKMRQLVDEFLSPEDKRLVDEVERRYRRIPIDVLPHCFVHGDIIKTNVVKGYDGRVHIIDFSVSNWYPRVQELAVICSSLLHNYRAYTSLQDRIGTATKHYLEAGGELTDAEQRIIMDYSLVAVAMELLGSHREKYLNNDCSSENERWLTLGRTTLQNEL